MSDRGGMHGTGGHAWQRGMHGRGHAWPEKRQLQQVVCILLERILLNRYFRSFSSAEFSTSLHLPDGEVQLVGVQNWGPELQKKMTGEVQTTMTLYFLYFSTLVVTTR